MPSQGRPDHRLLTGIGHATAERLAADGWKVYATARRPESIDDLAREGLRRRWRSTSPTRPRWRPPSPTVTEAEGTVGVLINNAGYSQSGAVESVPLDQIRRQFETNVFGLIRMCQLVLPGMREQGWGKIVNLSSMGGKLTFPGGGIYHATKYAVEAISDALRFEVRGFGVDVILIEPGLIVTGFARRRRGVGGARPRRRRLRARSTNTWPSSPRRPTRDQWRSSAAAPRRSAKTIAEALESGRPKARYPVTLSAHLMISQRRFTPDRVWDLMMRAQYPDAQALSGQQRARARTAARSRRRATASAPASSSAPNGPVADQRCTARRRPRRMRCRAACRRSRPSARGGATRPAAGPPAGDRRQRRAVLGVDPNAP